MSDSLPPVTGLVAGKYQVLGLIGRGGMGSVWEGRHTSLGTRVAIKFIDPEYVESKEACARFVTEARAAATIQSKHAIQIFDHGVTDDGRPYMVMELLLGEPLDKRIERLGTIPLRETARIIGHVCRALQRAHDAGIIHRDLKPENIFLVRTPDDDDEVAKVLDFGIAKIKAPPGEEGLSSSTKTGAVLGTPYYMSPEQARGDRNLDARVDLYACGVILYEALTGRRPFTAANYNALLLQILSSKPKPARDLRPALPNGFDAVLDKAMARNREDRYRTAAEFQRDLQVLRDRHNVSPQAAAAEAFRAISDRPPPLSPGASAAAVRIPAPPPRPNVRTKEPTPSSVEIPIVFSNDTPLSGENMPVEATEMESRSPPHSRHSSDAMDFEEYPTQVQQSPFDEPRPEEASTTQKRGPEFARQVAHARGIRDTDVTGRPAIRDSDATGRLIMAPRPRSSPDAREVRDDLDTVIKSSAAFPQPKRKGGRKPAASPDDTIKVDTEMGAPDDPTQLMGSRAPKAPRR
jgi:serine/threonine protein kinase